MKKVIKELAKYKTWVPPGHFYSPIPDIAEIDKRRSQIYNSSDPLLALNINEEDQLKFLEKSIAIYNTLPFQEEKIEELRYYYKNNMFSFGDAISLFLMLNHFKPKNIIEIGSGFSSAVMLDTRDHFAELKTNLTFIEPYADRLKSLLRDNEKIEIIESPIQDINLDIFDHLQSGDILFIDSTHVSKTGSDVNHIFFQILPKLKKGVIIHVHDIGPNFEYPYAWVKQGRAWNEAYILRAFLMYNDIFEIILYNSLIVNKYKKFFESNMPLYLKNSGGSLWMRKAG